MYLKNNSETPFKVFTWNLQTTLFNYKDKPRELHLDYSSQMNIEGFKVIPSESDLSPVTIRKDEIAEVRIHYRDRQNLDEVVLVYDMRNFVSQRYGAWYGQVKSGIVKVMKSEPKR
jgi:hypothetical protein